MIAYLHGKSNDGVVDNQCRIGLHDQRAIGIQSDERRRRGKTEGDLSIRTLVLISSNEMNDEMLGGDITIDHHECRFDVQLWTMIVFIENVDREGDIRGSRRVAQIGDSEP